MKYSIITPTYNRPEKLIRCVESVLNQKGNMENGEEVSSFDFELIVVNDSPVYDYSIFDNYLDKLKSEDFENFCKIKYFVNEKNMGVNYSRNYALDYVSKDTLSDYVIFLDDDDWLHDDVLKNINNILELENKKTKKRAIKWLVTNLFMGGVSVTKNNTNKNIINYLYDYLILKRFTGDVTHTIDSKVATQIRFSNKIKNGEEWLYFIKIKYNFLHKNITTKLSDGYGTRGLTKLEKDNYIKNTKILWLDFNNLRNIKILIILILRIVKIIINIFTKK